MAGEGPVPPVYAGTSGRTRSSDDFVERLTAELEEEIREYRRWRFRKHIRGLVRLALLLLLLNAALARQWGGFVWFLIFFGGTEVHDRRASRRRRVAGLLARTRDPRAVDVLARAHSSGDPATQTVAAEALKEMLPSLKASDARHISPEGLQALCKLLNMQKVHDPELILAVLEALKQVGTPQCIPAVQRVITTPYSTRLVIRVTESLGFYQLGATVRRIQDAALECLAVLQERERLERDRTTLLRPAERPDDSETLLRPASGAPSGDEWALVRPADPEGDPARDAAEAELRALDLDHEAHDAERRDLRRVGEGGNE